MLLGPTPGAKRTTSPARTAAPVGEYSGVRSTAAGSLRILRREAHADVVLAVAVAQLGRHDALDHAAQLAADAADAEAEVGRQRPIDARHDLRLSAFEVGADVHGARHLPHLRLDLAADPLQLRQVVRRARTR